MKERTSEMRFREVMGRFATGVAIVTGADPQGRPLGFTANAVASVSLDPLLVLVSVGRESASLPSLLETGRFALSFLGEGDEMLARRFAGDARGSRFERLDLEIKVTGAPVVRGGIAWLDCSLWKKVDAGDHVVLFGEVESCGLGRDADPLVFYRGEYRTVRP
jgi:flavin reductase (DIM6/NTAB) family NADH-FMN oxidoreductase RutF